jgi:hypothetical protein
MKATAHVIPPVGKPIKTGEIAPVTATIATFLETYPTARVTVREKADKHPGHEAVHVWRDGDDWYYSPRLGLHTLKQAQHRRDALTKEVLRILGNLGIHPTLIPQEGP